MSNRIVPSGILWALCAVFLLASAPALADDHRRGHGRDHGESRWHHGHGGKHLFKHHKRRHLKHRRAIVIWHGHRRGHRQWAPPPRRHHYGHRPRPRHHYDRHYRHRSSHDGWALYAILALQLADALNESQQQSYACAQQRAAAVPLGQSIGWQDSGAYGSVTPIREGTDGGGRYCREFQHQITVGNGLRSGYGIACRRPDGAWEIGS